ncbi:MAG: hypothetical protein ABIV26_02590, partial [Candidatus Limnocylindrales bacterium]
EAGLSARLRPFAILPGPAAAGPGAATFRGLLAGPWHVAGASDRRGLRLDGQALTVSSRADAPSHGVPIGAIQLTPSGQPLVLMADAGPTGGYPVLAVVTSADLDRLGQLGPGDEVRFRGVDIPTARAAERERRAALEARSAQLGVRDPWDDLADHAGA